MCRTIGSHRWLEPEHVQFITEKIAACKGSRAKKIRYARKSFKGKYGADLLPRIIEPFLEPTKR